MLQWVLSTLDCVSPKEDYVMDRLRNRECHQGKVTLMILWVINVGTTLMQEFEAIEFGMHNLGVLHLHMHQDTWQARTAPKQ